MGLMVPPGRTDGTSRSWAIVANLDKNSAPSGGYRHIGG
ncbi:hypothetical protein KR76_00113 [Pimelobacter simplex]|uniref:Uncharacterized protein n=1 Tax=Nocardioides simplex TaxID=2045 RepID=A0A0C5XM26_NOCSI|nr:hypothetical protein KR76_00113 [Pimelobacter simplex]